INLQERQRTAGAPAAAELFFAGTDGRQVGAGAGAKFEKHGLAVGQVHDRLHVVLDRLDETGATLWVFILGPGALGLAGLAVVKPVASAGLTADAILMIKADI